MVMKKHYDKSKRKPQLALPKMPKSFTQEEFDRARNNLSAEKQRKAKRSVAALKREQDKAKNKSR